MKTLKSIVHLVVMPFAISAALLHAPAVFAHAGEDHGDGPSPAQTTQPLAPRAEAHSDDIEMLAVYGNGELTLYLSDFKTNEPISDAKVELESGSDSVVAAAAGEGVYKLPAPWLAKPGKHGLVVSVEGKDVADLLEASLDIPDVAAETKRSGIGDFAPAGLIGSLGGIALLGLVALGLRRRKK
jgi:hypothetical protein